MALSTLLDEEKVGDAVHVHCEQGLILVFISYHHEAKWRSLENDVYRV